MLSPQNKILELNQPLSSFRPNNSSRASRQNSPKYSPTLSPRQKKQNQDDNILIKACCPNCRYIFKVVDDNKLNKVKQKLSRMDTNLNMGRQSHRQITNSNYQKPSYPKQTQTQHGKQIKRNETPKFLQKSPKKREINEKNISKSKGKQSSFAMKYEKKPLSPSKDNKKQLKNSQFESPINKLQITVKSPTNQRIQHSQDQIGIKKDIETMKKYLNKLSPEWTHLKSHNTSKNEVSLIYDESNNFNRSMEKTKNEFMRMDIQNYSSIPKKSLEITRKCPQCNAGHIEIQTAISAAKSKLVQNEIAMMAHFVGRDTSTPSYIKCLQQYSQSL